MKQRKKFRKLSTCYIHIYFLSLSSSFRSFTLRVVTVSSLVADLCSLFPAVLFPFTAPHHLNCLAWLTPLQMFIFILLPFVCYRSIPFGLVHSLLWLVPITLHGVESVYVIISDNNNNKSYNGNNDKVNTKRFDLWLSRMTLQQLRITPQIAPFCYTWWHIKSQVFIYQVFLLSKRIPQQLSPVQNVFHTTPKYSDSSASRVAHSCMDINMKLQGELSAARYY